MNISDIFRSIIPANKPATLDDYTAALKGYQAAQCSGDTSEMRRAAKAREHAAKVLDSSGAKA